MAYPLDVAARRSSPMGVAYGQTPGKDFSLGESSLQEAVAAPAPIPYVNW